MAQPEESEPLPRPPTHVDTDMFFLDRLEAYKHTKPYMITFDAGGLPGPKTNHAYSKHPVCVHDARQDKQRFSLDSHGFQFRDWTSAVAGPAFDDDDAVRGVYYAEIRRNLRSCFPYLDYVHVFAHLVS